MEAKTNGCKLDGKEVLYILTISPHKLLINYKRKVTLCSGEIWQTLVNQVIKTNINKGASQHHVPPGGGSH